MPELPEVETTLRGISPYLLNQKIVGVHVKQRFLRWEIKSDLQQKIKNSTVQQVRRRGKYLIIDTTCGAIILHLGMSGTLCVVKAGKPFKKHDHVEFLFDAEIALRFNDPRRFGFILWTADDPLHHRLLSDLGKEPLSDEFDATFIFERTRNRSIAIKPFLMDAHFVVGIGNIYATESLFMALIHPNRAAESITFKECQKLCASIKKVLNHAIELGGTTLKDFTQSDGRPGYFSIQLMVYGKDNQPCPKCSTTIQSMKLRQRNSWYCPKCQK